MKHFFKFLIFSVIVVSISFGIYKITNKYSVNILAKNLDWSISTKGLSSAISFDFDDEGNLYIAFINSIRIIKEDNKEEILIKNKDYNIWDICIYKNNLVIATDNRIIIYDLDKGESRELLNNLPNLGMNKSCKLAIDDDNLYITIGSNTNSGIVDGDGKAKDIPSFEWIMTGYNYGENKTGAFKDYGVLSHKDEKTKEGEISNASILSYNFTTGKITTFATGIRNIEGLSVNSEGNLIGIVGGMLDVGVRPVKDDKDYIYEIKEKAWYGWPDYSGGDPINSARFSDGTNKLDFVLENPPTKVPLGPIYQHSSVNSLKGLAIDIDGTCLLKDTIVFADNNQNYIYALTKDGVIIKLVHLGAKSKVEKIKYNNGNIYVLDSIQGCLFKLQGGNNKSIFNLPVIIWGFAIIFTLVILISLYLKVKVIKRK